MTHLEYFKLQAKNLFKDYKTKTLSDEDIYEHSPKYFDIDEIVVAYDIDEESFTLMNAQHIIALMVGFRKWTDLIKATEAELELAKLLLDNRDKVPVDEWEFYIARAEQDNQTDFDDEARLEIFKQVFLKGGNADNEFMGFSLN